MPRTAGNHLGGNTTSSLKGIREFTDDTPILCCHGIFFERGSQVEFGAESQTPTCIREI